MRFAHYLPVAALLILTACSSPKTPEPEAGNGTGNEFDIDLVFGSGITDDQKQLFEDAAARWEKVITDDLPDTPLTKKENACKQGDPAFEGTVDDLLIYVDAAPRDGSGGVLGASGPCFTREESSLPLYGTLNLDSADLDRPSSLILHEMGHVLGFGLLWNDLELTRACPNDLRYFGEDAGREWGTLGGSGELLVEDKPNAPGTQCVHWEQEVFGRELMTSRIRDGDTARLSRLTIGALGDLGYTTDKGAADPYRLPVTSQNANSNLVKGNAQEMVLSPSWSIDENGRVAEY